MQLLTAAIPEGKGGKHGLSKKSLRAISVHKEKVARLLGEKFFGARVGGYSRDDCRAAIAHCNHRRSFAISHRNHRNHRRSFVIDRRNRHRMTAPQNLFARHGASPFPADQIDVKPAMQKKVIDCSSNPQSQNHQRHESLSHLKLTQLACACASSPRDTTNNSL